MWIVTVLISWAENMYKFEILVLNKPVFAGIVTYCISKLIGKSNIWQISQ